MLGRSSSCTRVAAALAVAAIGLASCTSSVSHYPLPPIPTRHVPTSSPPPHKSAQAANAARCAARKDLGGTPVAFRGTETPHEFCGVIWSSDMSHDCARHAYGAAVIAFIRRHKCGPVRRILATVYVEHFSINLSSVIAKFRGTEADPNNAAVRFSELATSRRTGGIADFLRDGRKIPGSHGPPPSNASYGVKYLLTSIDAVYLWYGARPASTKGWRSLARLEGELSFSRLTGPP